MVVLTVGVFDLLHFGHFELFRRARELAGPGGSLTVAVQRDDFVTRYKPQAQLVYDFETRCKMVASLRDVDKVVPYEDIDRSITEIPFDVFVLGGDQVHSGFIRAVEWCRSNGRRVIRLPRTAGISSSKLRHNGLCM